MGEFRHKYRTVDVLLIDDIQFLAGKDRTKEEFFHTFNALHEINKQIVISSDRPPKEIPTLEDRLRSASSGASSPTSSLPISRRAWPSSAPRLSDHGSLIPEAVLSFIAHKVQRNIRELEGALTRVQAFAAYTRDRSTKRRPRGCCLTSSPPAPENRSTSSASRCSSPTTTTSRSTI